VATKKVDELLGGTKKVTLYRGDSVPTVSGKVPEFHRGRTYAELFLGNGVMAKFGDCGRSVDLKGREFVDLIIEHVGYDYGEEETRRAFHSPLISFSKSRDAAIGFANRRMRDLEPCSIEDASHFLWRFEPELREWEEPGKYAFIYRGDPCNCQKLSLEKLRRSMQPLDEGNHWPFGQALGELLAQGHAAQDVTTHLAIVFDTKTYLKNVDLTEKEPRLVENALARAQRDKEWLVFPADRMPGTTNSFDARLQMNASLFADEWFRAKPRVKKPANAGKKPTAPRRRAPQRRVAIRSPR
jgi:hypothetical protein